MRFVAISDTHNKHKDLVLPEGDVLLHAGEVSGRGYEKEIKKFLNWFSEQPFKYKIFIAGNHDFFFEQKNTEEVKQIIPENVIYLNDSGITIEGIKIWGSPIQPWFHNWAFNRQRGAGISKHWELIPKDTDILITHGPPFEVLDMTVGGMCVGCEDLTRYVNEIKPRYHIFGHIHEAYGQKTQNATFFVNASVLNERYELVNPPVVFDL